MSRGLILAGLVVLAAAGAWFWFTPSGPEPVAPPPEETPAQAVAAAREEVKASPADPAARLRLARALRRQGRAAEAAEALGVAKSLGIPEREGRREAALLLAAGDWPPQAEGILQQAARDYPDDPEVLLAVAGAFAAKERWTAAEALYSQLLAAGPPRPEWHFRRGEVRMKAANYGPAVADFRAALAADPGSYQARLYLANSLLGDARMAEAERELEAVRQMRPERVEPLVGLAKCAVERDDLTAAAGLLDRAAALDGDSPLVLQEQASLQLRQQQTDRSIATLGRLLTLDPENRQGHLQMAQALLAAGKPAAAKRHEQIYQELDRREEARAAAKRGMR